MVLGLELDATPLEKIGLKATLLTKRSNMEQGFPTLDGYHSFARAASNTSLRLILNKEKRNDIRDLSTCKDPCCAWQHALAKSGTQQLHQLLLEPPRQDASSEGRRNIFLSWSRDNDMPQEFNKPLNMALWSAQQRAPMRSISTRSTPGEMNR